MPARRTSQPSRTLPTTFSALATLMQPKAISTDDECDAFIDMIDRLMQIAKLSKDQALYLETLVQLVEAYEAKHHTISSPEGIDLLKQLLGEHAMNASDLARLLGVHPSMGSKILKEERALTIDHLKALALRFRVRPDLFIDTGAPHRVSATIRRSA
jgi:HTH-type transcriptional regulator / antitoxin HigA